MGRISYGHWDIQGIDDGWECATRVTSDSTTNPDMYPSTVPSLQNGISSESDLKYSLIFERNVAPSNIEKFLNTP